MYEFDNIKSVDFNLFTPFNIFTDDTVMTIAVVDWLLSGDDIALVLRRWGHKYPEAGYGGMFFIWLFSWNHEDQRLYGSFGNGAGMRVSPFGFSQNL